MFNTAILDVAIGIIFVYLLLSLMCSAANEIVELWLKKRATDLERGIRELLVPNSASGTNNDLVHQLYDHALINGLFKGRYADSGIVAQSRLARFWRYVKGTRLPAYIPSRNFALGLMDLILPGTAPAAPAPGVPAPPPPVASGATGATPSTFEVSLAAVPPPPAPAIAAGNPLQPFRAALGTNPLIANNPIAQKALIALVDAAGNDVAKARENIENWYNNSMDRVSGWYKRRSQCIILVIGLLVTIGVNADSIRIAKALSSDRALRESLVAAADAYAKANALPNPSVTPTPSSTPTAKPTPTPTPTRSPTATPTPTPTPVASPTPATSPTPTASPTPDSFCSEVEKECKGKADSSECKFKKSQCALERLGLPIGWTSPEDKWPGLHFWYPIEFLSRWYPAFRLHFFGWLLTALAISLGAPFWFDMLNKFIVIRSTVKPKEKSPEEKSKD